MDSKKISFLVGVDFSGVSLRAMAEAVRLSRKTGGTIEAVHVTPSTVATPIDLVDGGQRELADLSDSERRLAELCAIAAADGAPTRAHLCMGDPAQGLINAIIELAPDLVLLGSRGHGAVVRALLGSVSDEVWRKSPVPVVIVPAIETREHVRVGPVMATGVAWCCVACGHIRAPEESAARCAGCGASPTRWTWAPIFDGPVDTLAPAVGHAVGEEENSHGGGDNVTASLFSTSAPGGSPTNVNPELRVRY